MDSLTRWVHGTTVKTEKNLPLEAKQVHMIMVLLNIDFADTK
jgi:hypothetical protein